MLTSFSSGVVELTSLQKAAVTFYQEPFDR
jgi:hypothetical protein